MIKRSLIDRNHKYSYLTEKVRQKSYRSLIIYKEPIVDNNIFFSAEINEIIYGKKMYIRALIPSVWKRFGDRSASVKKQLES
jgi:hypothetical protein